MIHIYIYSLQIDYYKLLKISKNSTQDEIKQAHRKQSVRFHPDSTRDPDLIEKFKQKQIQLNQAINVLLNPQKREIYDFYQKQGLGVEKLKQLEDENVIKQQDLVQQGRIKLNLDLNKEECQLGTQKQVKYGEEIWDQIYVSVKPSTVDGTQLQIEQVDVLINCK